MSPWGFGHQYSILLLFLWEVLHSLEIKWVFFHAKLSVIIYSPEFLNTPSLAVLLLSIFMFSQAFIPFFSWHSPLKKRILNSCP